MKHFVVAIAREYGSQGAEIGRKLADRLGVTYYDSILVNEAAHKLGINEKELAVIDECISRKKALVKSLPGLDEGNMSDELIEAQSDIIRRLAERESCVIIGRCANYVLKDRDDCLSVYIYAPFEKRVDHIMSVHPEYSRRKAKNLVEKMDRTRRNYYYYVTGKDRDTIYEQQIMCDSNIFGVDGTVELLENTIKRQFAD
ncbi:MAG: cytidylate kinase-like family protein [Lachnospira sp.]|nr:cytidylate kinase-like family protein [Lachnospira sp.]